MARTDSAAQLEIFGFRDSAFTNNRDLPVHRWIPWIAGFSAQFVEDSIAKYLSPATKRPWILDPFAGVGTTLVAGYLRGLNVVGFEINPYAALASKVKLEAGQIDAGLLQTTICAFQKFMKSSCASGKSPRCRAPLGFSGRIELFSPSVERKVLFVLDFINSIESPVVRDIFRLAFGSVMVSFSNYSYEPSLTRRAVVGKPPIEDAPVDQIVSAKLALMLTDVQWLQSRINGRKPEFKVYHDTFFSAAQLQQKASIDLLVTSPPYLNNYHYPRNTRPQLHWLGMASGTGYGGARETSSFGKFWQTVRSDKPIHLSFEFSELTGIIEEIRSRNTDKECYGGPGWANYAATYFNDTQRFCKIVAELLKPGAVALIVLGNSIIQGVEVKTDYFFGKIAETCGLTFEDTLLLRKKRTGNSIIQSSVRTDKAAVKTVLYESAIVLRK